MKKTRLLTILLLLTMLCSVFTLASCRMNIGQTPLSTPTVTLTDDTATWIADPSADKFEISVQNMKQRFFVLV